MGSLNSLLLITNGFDSSTAGRVASALGALPRGSAAIQLRAKDLSGRALYAATCMLLEVTSSFDAPLYVNDRVDVALAAGAQGVHLPARGLMPKPTRRVIAKVGERPFTVGVSTHSVEEAVMAERGGADYVIFGPVWSKSAVGVEPLKAVLAAVKIPVFAIGGIDADRALICRSVGARVACISAVLGADDPAAAARAVLG
jgi:thiamine-phosphate pyrophosphorylase